MKTLITILLITITGALYSQTYIDQVERMIRKMPPQWADGMSLEEVLTDECNGKHVFKISEGAFYTLYRETICADVIYKNIDVTDVLYNEKTLFIWAENGKIKSSFNGIVSKDRKKVMLLWKIKFIVSNGKSNVFEIIDLRGLMLNTLAYYK